MYAVMEIDKSVVDTISSSLRIASPMIKSSPTYPTGVTSAAVYIRTSHSVTVMEIKGNGYVVVNSSSISPITVLHDIKRLAERMGGRCHVLHGPEASNMADLANNVH